MRIANLVGLVSGDPLVKINHKGKQQLNIPLSFVFETVQPQVTPKKPVGDDVIDKLIQMITHDNGFNLEPKLHMTECIVDIPTLRIVIKGLKELLERSESIYQSHNIQNN